jgi:hypothetical protein
VSIIEKELSELEEIPGTRGGYHSNDNPMGFDGR